MSTNITTKRIYDPPSDSDGCRVLVDRLWPRGMSKEKARIDLWLKEIAPSNELRKWYAHNPEKWEEFKERYRNELKDRKEAVERLEQLINDNEKVTLLFGSRNTEINHAVFLKTYLAK